MIDNRRSAVKEYLSCQIDRRQLLSPGYFGQPHTNPGRLVRVLGQLQTLAAVQLGQLRLHGGFNLHPRIDVVKTLEHLQVATGARHVGMSVASSDVLDAV